jgi:DNA-binding NarL/FixJ family response regulator
LTPSARISIVDRQSIFRDGLRRLLETDPQFRIVGEASDDRAAVINLVRELRPDILLIGMDASGSSTVETIRELATFWPSIRAIVLASSVCTHDVMHVLELGARGVIPKDSTPEVLFNSIHSVMAGHFWVGRERVAETGPGLRRFEAARRRSRAFGLTLREIDIVRAVVVGRTNREIAQQSFISENTVKRHLQHIFNKLGASNRLEVAIFASHHRLLDV